jgi:hypothetical protein
MHIHGLSTRQLPHITFSLIALSALVSRVTPGIKAGDIKNSLLVSRKKTPEKDER